MQELDKQITQLNASIDGAMHKLKINELDVELETIKLQTIDKDFWSDADKAQEIMKRQSKLASRVEPWKNLSKEVSELAELVGLKDESLETDLKVRAIKLEQQFNEMKQELKYSGPYDDYDVIMGIYAGAGGTDAQDWAAMLFRMYARWAEKNDVTLTTIEQSAGDEAGLKSITAEMSGKYLYAKMKGEHGVHRLVRLSPFNADNLRQTSFAKVDILPKIDKPDALVIDDKDLKVDVYRAGGHGGQSVNTTDSAVRVTHIPTGIAVAIQNERSQLQNKETAMTILRSKLVQLQIEQHREDIQELKGPNQSAEWGNQIRSYVLHPYKQVKDLRTRYETSDAEGVLEGNLNPFIQAFLEHTLGNNK